MIWPEPVLLSIYNAFPRRTGRPRALVEIAAALDRISQGEIDGRPRTPEEAIAFLREKTDEARAELVVREKKFIPHPATFFHQSRYLRTKKQQELPARLEECIAILSLYPKMPAPTAIRAGLETFLPALMAIDRVIERAVNQEQAEEYRQLSEANWIVFLKDRTALYAACVSTWQPQELQFVPNPKRWYEEARFEQPEQQWTRNSYSAERDQIRKLLS